jgi:Fe-S cluster assembly ATP-binding protein
MGPNGSGKSTLSKVLAGHPDYHVTAGEAEFEINFKLMNLLEMAPDQRAREGLFLAFQYPIEVPGVSNFEFLRACFNSIVTHQGGEELDVFSFDQFLKEKMKLLNINENFAGRQLNVGFSGGEKKRNEILQMAVLSPRLAILDETDSGLDIDALKQVSEGINKLRSADNSFVLITHYERILDSIVPDYIHILYNGKIVTSGDRTLAKIIEKNGFEPFIPVES